MILAKCLARWEGYSFGAESEKLPWENGGKQPKDYTWEEYEALPPLQKEAFFEWFESGDDFDRWLERVNGGASETEKMPWEESGAKQPKDYIWEEYEKLTVLQKEAFFESFEDIDDFDAWLTANQP